MLDIKFIRENSEKIKEAVKKVAEEKGVSLVLNTSIYEENFKENNRKGVPTADYARIQTLTVEMEKKNIVANPNREAVGTIIESHIDKGAGPQATVLVQTGSLKNGDK
jgi:translation initiation factor IF-2